MTADARGCPVSTRSADALAHLEQASWRLCSFYGTPLEDLEAASAADPGWMLPHVLRAGFLLSLTEHRLLAPARDALVQAAALAGHGHERERAHLVAVRQCLHGLWEEACRTWDDLLLACPHDIAALQLAHLFDFYRGDARNLRQRVARVLPEWLPEDPLYPFVLGMYAFGLEECNLYPQAEAMGRLALAGGTQVPWAVHAVSHVMEMQGRHDEGRAWLEAQRGSWAEDGNGLAGHNGWHLALFHLESLDIQAALACHDEWLATEAAQDITLQRLDASALLWRLHLLGADVGSRWNAVADAWQADEAASGYYAFNDVHAVLALIGAGRMPAALDRVARVVAALPRLDAGHQAMARDIGLPLMHGLLAFGQGRHDDAVAELYPVREVAHRFGGSHAQRDLIDQTLLAAATAGTSQRVARGLLNERALAKPVTPLTRFWAARCLGRADSLPGARSASRA